VSELEPLGVEATPELLREAGYGDLAEGVRRGIPAPGHLAADARAHDIMRRSGEYGDDGALVDMQAYLSLSIDEALALPSPLVRALAVVDRRVGKRRLASLAAGPKEHPLVRELLALRLAAEASPERTS
jgi:hypothetical protein